MWPASALEFLRELEANNDRDWFKANRGRYDADLVAPARELAARLSHLGAAHLFRPYNDPRFPMKPPIKEQLGVAIGYGGAGGYYVELSLDGLLVAAGLPHPASAHTERVPPALRSGGALPRSHRRRPPGSRVRARREHGESSGPRGARAGAEARAARLS